MAAFNVCGELSFFVLLPNVHGNISADTGGTVMRVRLDGIVRVDL